MSNVNELKDYIRENPSLIGHENEFIYAVYTIEASIGIHADLGIMGEPFSGKRQFCIALKKWFDRKGLICGILKMDDDSTFDGDVVFLLDSDPVKTDSDWKEKREARIRSFASGNTFVVYTSVVEVFGTGETIALKELKQEDFLRLIREISGYEEEIAAFSEQMNIPLPRSPLIAKSVCNHLLGFSGVTSDSIGEIMEMHKRQRGAVTIIPKTERDLWKNEFESYNPEPKTWKATRCGVRFFIKDDGLTEYGICSREGSGFVFSETMCALSHCIWGEPNDSDYSDAIQLNIEALKSENDLPQIFYDDAIRLSTSVLNPKKVMEIGLDLVLFYIMNLVRYRVYDSNRQLSCAVLLQNAKALKEIKDIFEELEKDLIKDKRWDKPLEDALNKAIKKNSYKNIEKEKIKKFIAREIKTTVSSDKLKEWINNKLKPADVINEMFINEVCEQIVSVVDSSDGWSCYEFGLTDDEKEYSKLLQAIRNTVDNKLLDIKDDFKFKEDEEGHTRTVMGFQKTISDGNNKMEQGSRQSPWVHLLWDEFEINARWVNLKTVNGYADSSRLINCIDYIHEVNKTYPLSRFKPVNEEIDFSSIKMYSELLDLETFNLYNEFKDSQWYKTNYELEKNDRSVIYLEKSKCRVRWEKGEDWKTISGVWDELYEEANKAKCQNDSLMLINLLGDLFHYFRLYCERDEKKMRGYLKDMEDKHRKSHKELDRESLKVGYALITLELSRAELLCGQTVKSMEYLDIVRSMEANDEVDVNSAPYRVALMDTEARLEFDQGKIRSAIRKMEDMRSECLTNGLVSQYVVAGKHLYIMYDNYGNLGNANSRNGNSDCSNRRISKDRLRKELERYVQKLEEQKEEKNEEKKDYSRYQLVLDIIKPVISCDSESAESDRGESGAHGRDKGTEKTDDSSLVVPADDTVRSKDGETSKAISS